MTVRALALLALLALQLPAEQRTILDDETASVSIVDIAPADKYSLEAKGQYGCVWIALGNLTVADNVSSRPVRAGDTGTLTTGETASFSPAPKNGARLVIVAAKRRIQDLTVQLQELRARQELQEASDSNETLIVAVSNVSLRDVWNMGDESEWKSSKPRYVNLKAGEVTWVKAGMHHFKNLSQMPSRFVTIEW